MYDLTLIQHNGGVYIDSREVAVMIDKRHNDLLRDIRGYIKIMDEAGERKIAHSDFFLESSYRSAQNKEMPCYLLSKMGCELTASKLTGEKGILFSAAYVTKFNEMEQRECAELEALALEPRRPEPRLGEINACARLIVSGMKALGATPDQVMRFLKETYEPLGFDMELDVRNETAPRWHNANGIARECGIYSLSGKPHGQAAASILKEILCIGEEHRRTETDNYGFQVGFSALYDDYALLALLEWLRDNECPEEIEAAGRSYHVQYQF